jgi:GNAT superfamily N-acetyltransferase
MHISDPTAAADNYEVRQGELLVSTSAILLDRNLIHEFLTTSYWSPGITREQVDRQIRHSTLGFGLYRTLPFKPVEKRGVPPKQIGFCRVVSDLARFAYLADVFIVEAEQRKGLGSFLLNAVVAHPELKGIRKWMLATQDAHGVYERLGFTALPNPEAYMVWKPDDARWV